MLALSTVAVETLSKTNATDRIALQTADVSCRYAGTY